MRFSENITSEFRYLQLMRLEKLTIDNIGELIRYPFKSLVSYCTDLTANDIRAIKKIENQNILNLFNTLRIVLGHGSDEEQQIFNRNLSVEPLKSAVLASRLYADSRLRYVNFIKSACKIILTQNPKKIYSFVDPINVRIMGSMPWNFLKSRQEIGDKWFNDFVEAKLLLFEKLIMFGVGEDVFPTLATSFAYSIYSFSPEKFYIPININENDAVYMILEKFIKNNSTQ